VCVRKPADRVGALGCAQCWSLRGYAKAKRCLFQQGRFFDLFLNCLQPVEQNVAMCGMCGALELLKQSRPRQLQRIKSLLEDSLFGCDLSIGSLLLA